MQNNLTEASLRALPKVELHCHLDGSVPLSFYQDLASRGFPGMAQSPAALRAQVEAPQPCKDLAQYLESFALPLQVLADMDNLYAATTAIAQEMAAENVVYAELRFAPLIMVSPKADAATVIRTILSAMKAAEKGSGIQLRALLCMMRHMEEEENRQVLELAHQFQSEGAVGVDLAGDEAAFPAARYASLFRRAADMGLPYTIHAGECHSAENIRESVAMGARRIGHGVAAAGNTELCHTLVQEGVLLENCPVSNLQTGAVASWESYPLLPFVEMGVSACVNTDNRTVSATSLTGEFSHLAAHFKGVDAEFVKARTLAALQGAFIPETEKAPLRAAIQSGYAQTPAEGGR